jgi:hypothetical protein
MEPLVGNLTIIKCTYVNIHNYNWKNGSYLIILPKVYSVGNTLFEEEKLHLLRTFDSRPNYNQPSRPKYTVC